jgi:hypothetical protein
MEYVQNFTSDWKRTSFNARLTFLTILMMTVTVVTLTAMVFWYTSILTIRYAVKNGDNLLVLFGQHALIVFAFIGFVWLAIHADLRRHRRDDRAEAERQIERSAAIRSARVKATIMRLKVAVGVWP